MNTAQRLAAIVATCTRWGIDAEKAIRRPSPPDPRWHEGGTGAPLVLLNGFGASGRVWPDSWIRTLEQTFRVIRIDARGIDSDGRAGLPFTMADLADDVVGVLDLLDIGRTKVLGLSMGGMVAQELALRYPDRVEHAYLVATVPPAEAHIPTIDYRRVAGAALRHARRRGTSSAEFLARFYLDATGRTFDTSADVVTELAGQLRDQSVSASAVLHQVRAIAAWRGADRLTSLAVPTTIVVGLDDPIVLPRNSAMLARLIPSAELIELERVGHLVPWEAPLALVSILGGKPGAEHLR